MHLLQQVAEFEAMLNPLKIKDKQQNKQTKLQPGRCLQLIQQNTHAINQRRNTKHNHQRLSWAEPRMHKNMVSMGPVGLKGIHSFFHPANTVETISITGRPRKYKPVTGSNRGPRVAVAWVQ